LVDYYLLLNGTADLDTSDIRSYFHMSLDQQGEEMKLGNFTVDPKSTDFTGTQADHGPSSFRFLWGGLVDDGHQQV
jgi:hypothetical protein